MPTTISDGFSEKGSSQMSDLTTETDALATAMAKVTSELNKVENIFNLQPGKDGELPEIKPEDQPFMPGGKLPTIEVDGEAVFKAPDSDAAHGPLDDLADKATLTAGALQALYDKLSETAPIEAVIAQAAYGPAGESILPQEGDEDAMGLDGETPLTPEEEIAQLQETEEAKAAIEEETASQAEERKKKETATAKKNMMDMIGMTKFGQKAMGAIKKAESLKNAVANTAEAISVAAASAAPPFNIPPIAQAVATGAAQIATIKGQFHGGIDSVPNSGTYLLEKGERVVDRRLNADLKNYLEKGRNTVNNTIDNPITLNFAEDTSEDTMFENRYVLEGMLRDLYDEYAIPSPFD